MITITDGDKVFEIRGIQPHSYNIVKAHIVEFRPEGDGLVIVGPSSVPNREDHTENRGKREGFRDTKLTLADTTYIDITGASTTYSSSTVNDLYEDIYAACEDNLGGVGSSISGSAMNIPITHSVSAGDFSATYTSTSTLTLTSEPSVSSLNIKTVLIYKVDNTAVLYTQGVENIFIKYSASVISIYESGVLLTPFASGDLGYDVGIAYNDVGRDLSINADLVSVLNPEYSHRTDSAPYTTFTPTGGTAYVEGTVICAATYNILNFVYSKTASNADDYYIKVIYLDASDSAVDYQETLVGAPVTSISTVTSHVYKVDKAALVNILTISTKGFPYMRIDIAKITNAGTDSIWTTKYNLK